MDQQERVPYLLKYLIKENSRMKPLDIPTEEAERKKLLRALMNIREPKPIGRDFLRIQDEYLAGERDAKGIVTLADIPAIRPGIYLWQGDITRLAADAIVNAANSEMLGCFAPCHGCIDNAIHSAAGVQLRLECFEIMRKQKTPEPTGQAKITKAWNLPCKYVLHTVGPIIQGAPSEKDCGLLTNCYRACLDMACAHFLKSVAFCCISTGEFHFPNETAAELAIRTVMDYQREHDDAPEVIFNVFKDIDHEIYKKLLV